MPRPIFLSEEDKMGYVIAFIISTAAIGSFCYSVGYNAGSAAAFTKARIQIYGK
jgi:hypothetical protein